MATAATTTLVPGSTGVTEVVLQLFTGGTEAYLHGTVINGGHNWPTPTTVGNPPVATHLNATRSIVDFWHNHAGYPCDASVRCRPATARVPHNGRSACSAQRSLCVLRTTVALRAPHNGRSACSAQRSLCVLRTTVALRAPHNGRSACSAQRSLCVLRTTVALRALRSRGTSEFRP